MEFYPVHCVPSIIQPTMKTEFVCPTLSVIRKISAQHECDIEKATRNAWWSYGWRSCTTPMVMLTQLRCLSTFHTFRHRFTITGKVCVSVTVSCAFKENYTSENCAPFNFFPIRYSHGITAWQFPCDNNKTTARRKPQRKMRWMPAATHVYRMLRCGNRRILEC